MRGIKLFFFFALILSVSVACNQPSVEDEVDDVCECIKNAESEAGRDVCMAKMKKISNKYAFDPEAAEDIKKRLKECAPK